MIMMTHIVSGNEIGEALLGDPEEIIFVLETLAAQDDWLINEITESIAGTTAEKVSEFARTLADAIDNRK